MSSLITYRSQMACRIYISESETEREREREREEPRLAGKHTYLKHILIGHNRQWERKSFYFASIAAAAGDDDEKVSESCATTGEDELNIRTDGRTDTRTDGLVDRTTRMPLVCSSRIFRKQGRAEEIRTQEERDRGRKKPLKYYETNERKIALHAEKSYINISPSQNFLLCRRPVEHIHTISWL